MLHIPLINNIFVYIKNLKIKNYVYIKRKINR